MSKTEHLTPAWRLFILSLAALLPALLKCQDVCAQELRFTKPLAPGVVLKQTIQRQIPNPLIINVLEVDPYTPGLRIECAVARPRNGQPLARREAVSSIASRTGALAGVNASFFTSAGDTIGLAVSNRELLSGPYRNRVCVGWTRDGKLLIDFVTMTASARLGEQSMPVAGINRARSRGELVIYTPAYGSTTLTDAAGSEAVLTGVPLPLRVGETSGVVSLVRSYAGRCPIPPDGIVLSGASGPASDFIRQLKPGDKVDFSISLTASDGTSWNDVTNAISGGPYVVKNAREYIDLAAEGFAQSFGVLRHPRTLLGVTESGRLLIVTVDGRQSISAGMTLQEAARLMLSLGAVTAVNLDGGGSTTLAVRGVVVNSPSDGKERPVTTALVLYSASEPPQPPPQITIEPASATAASDTTVAFTVRAADNSASVAQPDPKDILWGVRGGIGFVNQNGEFTGIKVGTGTVHAWLRGATATSSVTVVPGRPASLKAKAEPDPQDPLRIRVTAVAADANANPVPGAAVTFSPSAGGQAVPAETQTDTNGTAWADVSWTLDTAGRIVTVTSPGLPAVTVSAPRTRQAPAEARPRK
ncbi:MAG: phosphodiester glycosidase family protein [Armatimonadota bacterium]